MAENAFRRNVAGRLAEQGLNFKEIAFALDVSPQVARNLVRPDYSNAHLLVNHALADGLIVRPDACVECGKGGRLHAHHDDYNGPYDVRWLCPLCHVHTHKAARA